MFPLCGLFLILTLCRPVVSATSQSPRPRYVESPAVAALYPDPPETVVIDSPAFRKPAPEFTTHDEMMAFIEGLKSSPNNVDVESLGKSQDGRDIPLLKITKAREGSGFPMRSTVLILGHQHGNERAGGEAALAIASKLAVANESWYNHLNVLIVPRVNPDGASRNVRGLTNGDDVNRDHLLLQSPEGRAIASVFQRYNPQIVMDCHEFTVADRWLNKFKGLQKPDGMLQYATVPNLAPSLLHTVDKIRAAILDQFNTNNLTHDWYYTTNLNTSDKSISMGGVSPDTGRNIAGLRNAVSFLLETRGIGLDMVHFKRRVFTHLVAIEAILKFAGENPKEVLNVRVVAEAETIAAVDKDMTVVGTQTAEAGTYTLIDPVTGSDKVVNVRVNTALKIQNILTRKRPFGYIIKASENRSIETLQQLGVKIERTCKTTKVEKYVVKSVLVANKTDVTGSTGLVKTTVLRLATDVESVEIDVAPEDYYVAADQALGNLVVTALEPESQSSFPANYFLKDDIEVGQTLPIFRVVQRLSRKFPLTGSGSPDTCSNSVKNHPASVSSYFAFALTSLILFLIP